MKRGQYELGEGLGGPALAYDGCAVSPGLFLLYRVAFRHLQITSMACTMVHQHQHCVSTETLLVRRMHSYTRNEADEIFPGS